MSTVNHAYAQSLFTQLHGNPFGKTFIERKGYGLKIVYDKARRQMRIIKPCDLSDQHYRIVDVCRLKDAVDAKIIVAGEEQLLWEEYRNFYKWQAPKEYLEPIEAPEHLDNGPLGDDYNGNPMCIWPREEQSEQPMHYLDANDHRISGKFADEKLLADATLQATAWRNSEGQRKSYYWGAQFSDEMADLRETCSEASELDLWSWLEVAEDRLSKLGEPNNKNIREFTRLEQIVDIIDGEIVARRRNTFRGWNGFDDFRPTDEWFDNRESL